MSGLDLAGIEPLVLRGLYAEDGSECSFAYEVEQLVVIAQ